MHITEGNPAPSSFLIRPAPIRHGGLPARTALERRATHRPCHAKRTSANARGVIPEEEALDQGRRRVRLAGVIRKPTSNSAPGCGCPMAAKAKALHLAHQATVSLARPRCAILSPAAAAAKISDHAELQRRLNRTRIWHAGGWPSPGRGRDHRIEPIHRARIAADHPLISLCRP